MHRRIGGDLRTASHTGKAVEELVFSARPTNLGMGAAAGLLVLALLANLNQDDLTIETAAIPCLASTILGLIALRNKQRTFTGPFVYYIVYCLFHWGLVFAYRVGGSDVLLEGVRYEWLHGSGIGQAVSATITGAAAFVIAATIFQYVASKYVNRAAGALTTRRDDRESRVEKVAAVGVFSLGLVFLQAAVTNAGGAQAIASGYESFREEAAIGPFLTLALVMLGIGAILAASIPTAGKLAWVMIGVLFVVLLPIGFRSSALFPAAAVLVLRARFVRYPAGMVLASSLVLLPVISIIRDTRSYGVSALFDGRWDASWLQALAEMGFSLFVVQLAASWMAMGAEPWQGESLIVVPLRALEGILGRDVLPASEDRRFFSSEVTQLDGQVGGSPIAEGIRNGGSAWILVVMAIVAALLVAMTVLGRSTMSTATWAVLAYPSFMGVRNAFSSYYVYWMVGIAALLMFWLLVKLQQTRASHFKSRSTPE